MSGFPAPTWPRKCPLKHRQLLHIGLISNIIEWYDFSVYAYLAVIIGQLFFDAHNPKTALIKAFGVFSVSYLMRPLGSFLWGYWSDRYGRMRSLQGALVLMALPTVAMMLLPTYSSVGIVATVLLILCRLLQGFAAGGELPGAACYLYEVAPPKQRFFYGSVVASSSMLGVLLGSAVVAILHGLFNTAAIAHGAWRLPFLVGSLLTGVIFYSRQQMIESSTVSAAGRNNKKNKKSKKQDPVSTDGTGPGLREHKWPLAQIMLLNAFISIAFYLLFVWMPSYLQVFLHIRASQALASSTVGLFALIVLTLILGYSAPVLGRRNLAVASVVATLLVAYPLFVLLKAGSFHTMVIVQMIFALCLSGLDAVNMEMMASRFHRACRGRGVGIGFTLSTAVLGGTAPTICSVLIRQTGNDLAPVFLLIVAGLLALPAAVMLPQR